MLCYGGELSPGPVAGLEMTVVVKTLTTRFAVVLHPLEDHDSR